MIMPLYDDNSDRRLTPYVNYTIIAINVVVFVVFQGLGTNLQFTYAFSAVPHEIMTGEDVITEDRVLVDARTGRPIVDPDTRQPVVMPGLQPTPISVYITLITSIFMHGGIAHLLGNMLFLWIFGDNVEDALGHERYLMFYLLTGILASLAHVFTVVVMHGVDGPDAYIPSLGASGAISAVLGGYLLLHPNRQVLVLIFRFVTWVPAYVAIGIWFLFQIINSMGLLGGESNVAYGAHIGGFLAGLALVKVFAYGVPPAQIERRRRTAWDRDRDEWSGPPGS